MFKLFFYCALFHHSASVLIERSLIIKTNNGPIKGKLNEFRGIEYFSYQGIPYAESPSGKLRFKPPVPKKPWSEVLDATEEGSDCSQLSRFINEGTREDCLVVNVYVPRNGTDKLLPVMVFIHGGALQYQSARLNKLYGPQLLLGRDMIFVSMNYRLGPFGFLSFNIEEATGNAALKDILLSLKWVKQNIKNFGGDPNRVTVAGHCSGSVVVNYLLLTHQSDGLFNQAILLSGSAFSPRFFARHINDISFTLSKELGIKTDDKYKALENLLKLDATKILDAYDNMRSTHDSPIKPYAPFVPSKEIASSHAVFCDDPIEVFRKNGQIRQKVPVLVGLTAQEGINVIPYIVQHPNGIIDLRRNPENLIPSNIEYPIGSHRSKKLAKLLSETYFGKDMENFTLASLVDFISDTQFVYGVSYWINRYKNMTDSNSLFLYIFDFIGDLNKSNFYYKGDVRGTGHTDDTNYIFVSNWTRHLYDSIDKRTRLMNNKMVEFVTNFVYYGNPTSNSKLHWPDYGPEKHYMLVNEHPSVQTFYSHPLYPKMQFWERIYNEYYEYVESGGKLQKKIIP